MSETSSSASNMNCDSAAQKHIIHKKLQPGFTRDTLKYLAMAAMLLNHIANMFLPADSLSFEILVDIGYFTAVTMCYFLVEGYQYTHSKKNYGLRLLLFAVLSQLPFMKAFDTSTLNMMFTLFCCFQILVCREKLQNPALRTLCTAGLLFFTFFCDWPILAGIFTILFDDARLKRLSLTRAYAICWLLFVLANYNDTLYPFPYAAIHALLSGFGILFSAVLVLFFYNGRRIKHGRAFSKWFFYLFYPAHLTVLIIIRTLL